MKRSVNANSSRFLGWLFLYLDELDMGTVKFENKKYVIDYEYYPPGPDPDGIEGMTERVNPLLAFLGMYGRNLEAKLEYINLGEIQVRILDNSRLQIVSHSFNPVIDNLFVQIDKEIASIWPTEHMEAKVTIPIPAKSVKLPKSRIRLEKWRQVWLLIKPKVGKGNVQETANYIKTLHPELPHSRSVIAKIIIAGQDGRLDQKAVPKT